MIKTYNLPFQIKHPSILLPSIITFSFIEFANDIMELHMCAIANDPEMHFVDRVKASTR
jgi:hypothetical protein